MIRGWLWPIRHTQLFLFFSSVFYPFGFHKASWPEETRGIKIPTDDSKRTQWYSKECWQKIQQIVIVRGTGESPGYLPFRGSMRERVRYGEKRKDRSGSVSSHSVVSACLLSWHAIDFPWALRIKQALESQREKTLRIKDKGMISGYAFCLNLCGNLRNTSSIFFIIIIIKPWILEDDKHGTKLYVPRVKKNLVNEHISSPLAIDIW